MEIDPDIIDNSDFQALLAAIFRQAIEDYIKLQHPKHRSKKYLVEAFENAIDLFFDSDYRLLKIQNDDGDDMSLHDILTIITNDYKVDVEKVKAYVVKEATTFWDEKEIQTLIIPDHIVVNGHVFSVYHQEDTGYDIDYSEKTIHVNKRSNNTNEAAFTTAVMDIVCFYEDIALTKTKRDNLAASWFRVLKVNNCFSGDT